MKTLRPVIMTLALVFLLAGGMTGADFAIVPGDRMGPMKLGMSFIDGVSTLPQYGIAEALPNPYGFGMCNVESKVGLCITDFVLYSDGTMDRREGIVMVIGTDDPRFRLNHGPKVGDHADKFIAVLGTPDDESEIRYFWNSKGIWIGFDENGLVEAVIVFAIK